MNQIGLEGIWALYEQKGRAYLARPFLCAHGIEIKILCPQGNIAEKFYFSYTKTVC